MWLKKDKELGNYLLLNLWNLRLWIICTFSTYGIDII